VALPAAIESNTQVIASTGAAAIIIMSQQQADAVAVANPPSQVAEPANEVNQSYDPNIDKTLYIDNERFFRDLQDEGKEMTTKERDTYTGSTKNNAKKKRFNIKHGSRFYSGIYDLAKNLHNHYKDKSTLLPNIRQNDSEAVHMLGKQIILMRQTRNRGDIHSVVTDANQIDLSKTAEYNENQILSFLSQTELLKWVIEKWGKDDDKEMEATPDDFLRALGIMFTEDLREYIPYILTKDPKPNSNDPSTRMSLDSWTAKKNLVKRQLKLKFVDPDVVVTMDELWTSDEAREKIDERLGEGAYDSLNFNPNNPERIKLPWTEAQVWNHLSLALISYNKIMGNYKMNTTF